MRGDIKQNSVAVLELRNGWVYLPQILHDVNANNSKHNHLKQRACEQEGGNQLTYLHKGAGDLVGHKFSSCQTQYKFKAEAGDVAEHHLVADSDK